MSYKNYKNYDKDYIKFWNRCEHDFSHTDPLRWGIAESSQNTIQSFQNRYGIKDFGSQVPNSIIIDYGIGNGRLAIPFLDLNAKKYIGIDISPRQLNIASKFLKARGYLERCDLLKMPLGFQELRPDIFISQACIQHFPSDDYLIEWCRNVNRSKAQTLLLQYRHAENKQFNSNCPVLACKLNQLDLIDLLPRYELKYASKIEDNGYQHVWFDLIKNDTLLI